MSSVNITGQIGNYSSLYLSGSAVGTAPDLQLLATALDLYNNLDGVELPAVDPPDGIEPPLPQNLAPPGYDPQPFNHLTLPRLQPKASTALIVSVNQVLFTANGTAYDAALVSADWSSPLSGSAIGSVTLDISANQLTLSRTDIDFKSPITLALGWPAGTLNICSAFIINEPVFEFTEQGRFTVTFEIGDELALFERTARDPAWLYCGPEPTTAGQAANIYADTRSLLTRIYPAGQPLLEPAQPLLDETPHQYLQALYQPLNWDIRTKPSGGIIAEPRPSYDRLNALSLTNIDTLQAVSNFQNRYEIYSELTVENEFQVSNGFPLIPTSYTVVNGIISNDKPWFQGGYTETITTEYSLGDSVIHTVEITRGYVPTSSTLTAAQVEEDPCNPSTIPTVFGTITTRTLDLTYTSHSSGAYLVAQEQEWLIGLELRKDLVGPDYTVFDGTLTYRNVTYENTPQINSNVCQKNYTHYQTARSEFTYGFDDQFVFRLLSQETTTYLAEGINPNSGASAFIGSIRVWTETVRSGAWNNDVNTWVNQPVRTNPQSRPSESQWIRPLFDNIVSQSRVYLNTQTGVISTTEAFATSDFRPAESLDIPFAYTLEQLNTGASRFLLEQWGLANGLSVVVPFHLPVALGASVSYTGFDGITRPYIVYNIEFNIDSVDATKTITLLRQPDNLLTEPIAEPAPPTVQTVEEILAADLKAAITFDINGAPEYDSVRLLLGDNLTDGDANSPVTQTIGVVELAGDFGTTADNFMILFADSTDLQAAANQQFTLSCRFRLNSTVPQFLITKDNPDLSEREWFISIDTLNSCNVALFDGTSPLLELRSDTGGATVSPGVWHHLVYELDQSTNTLALELDGVRVSNTYIGTAGATTQPLRIGTNGQAAALPTDGLIDQVYIFHRLLNANEKSTLRFQSAPLSP